MHRSQRGITLIELMIVVAIVGVLATLAVFMFRKSSKQAKVSSEVAAMFTTFKTRQEAYMLENNSYLSTGDESNMYPAAPAPLNQAANELDSSTWPDAWTDLRMNPDKTAVHCSYVAVAGNTGIPNLTDTGTVGSIASSDFGYSPPTGYWYYLLAECDADNDSTLNSYYFARSDVEGIVKLNEGN